MYCRNCGAEVSDGNKFCENCGAKIIRNEKRPEKSFDKDSGRPVVGYEKNEEAPELSEQSSEQPSEQSFEQPVNNPPQQKSSGKTCCLVAAIVFIILFVILGCIFVALLVVGRTFFDNKAGDVKLTATPTTTLPAESATPTAAATITPIAVVNTSFDNIIKRDPLVQLKGNGEDTVTVMVYMNGSDLESEYSEATTDLSEMIKAGSSEKVNVVVQTMGTKKWHNYNISSRKTQIHELSGDGLKTVKELNQLDCTDEKTLSDFIIWSAQKYPADRYILLFWDHGGGPVYGFGYDEYNEEGMLTLDEIQNALKTSGVFFDFIGMDCCIMSSLEVCCALYDYCDYMILSEDFESGLGWYYTDWMVALYQNTSIPTIDLGKKIIDTMIHQNETKEGGDKSILALIDESMMKVLYKVWTDFAYANEQSLLGTNYSRHVKARGKVHPKFGMFSDWLEDDEEYTLSDYYITDIMAVATNIDSKESRALASAIDNTLIYVGATKGDMELTGISVTLPYGDYSFYRELKEYFTKCGFESEYIDWLGKFVESNYDDFYNYDSWDDDWSGWDYYEDDYDWDDWYMNDDQYYDYWSSDDYWGWDYWDYDDSWNYWLDERDDVDRYGDYYWYEDDWDWDYYEDDWFWGDDYRGDDWYW